MIREKWKRPQEFQRSSGRRCGLDQRDERDSDGLRKRRSREGDSRTKCKRSPTRCQTVLKNHHALVVVCCAIVYAREPVAWLVLSWVSIECLCSFGPSSRCSEGWLARRPSGPPQRRAGWMAAWTGRQLAMDGMEEDIVRCDCHSKYSATLLSNSSGNSLA